MSAVYEYVVVFAFSRWGFPGTRLGGRWVTLIHRDIILSTIVLGLHILGLSFIDMSLVQRIERRIMKS
jgi:hypothetical protein